MHPASFSSSLLTPSLSLLLLLPLTGALQVFMWSSGHVDIVIILRGVLDQFSVLHVHSTFARSFNRIRISSQNTRIDTLYHTIMRDLEKEYCKMYSREKRVKTLCMFYLG